MSTFVKMLVQLHIKEFFLAAILTVGVQVAFAAYSFTGITDERTKTNSKYSLKNLSALSHKSLSYSSLKSNLQFKGTQLQSAKEIQDGLEVSSMLKYDNGNTTYIYPYKFKVKVPKFKTPVPPDHH